MRKRFSTIALLFGVCLSSALAQNSKLKKAKQFLESFNYEQAIETYQQVVEKHDHPEAKIQLADLYRKTNNYKEAQAWYAQVVEIPEVQPIHYFYYGLMLQRNGDCKAAEKEYQKFLKLRPYDERRPYLKNACAYQEELLQKLSKSITVSSLDINSAEVDLGPAFYGNGLVFASSRNLKGVRKNRGAFLNLFFVPFKFSRTSKDLELIYGSPSRFSEHLDSKSHEAIVTFNQDQSQIFFTRNKNFKKKAEELVRLEIMSAKKEANGEWGALEPLPFNQANYSVAHPALSPDGQRLFFSSDLPGGFGGKDIYVSYLEEGKWGTPINLGPAINTLSDELYPFYAQEGKLYFASDGHFGLGGQDIYVVQDRGDGSWSKAENMGYPINTPFDDFGIIFSSEGRFGYFTSNRDGGKGKDDIYEFRRAKVPVQIAIKDANDGEGLADVLIHHSCETESFQTDEEGRLMLYMQPSHCCTLTTLKNGYELQELEVCAKTKSLSDTLFLSIVLDQSKTTELTGVVYDSGTGSPLEGAVVRAFAKDCEDLKPMITENGGAYRFKVRKGCCYEVKAEKGNYFSKIAEPICFENKEQQKEGILNIPLKPFSAKSEQIVEKTPVQPIEKIIEDNAFKMSSRVDEKESTAYLLNIYYNVGRTSVKKESLPELKKLLRLLEDNPGIIIEISSHTDARGSARFNKKLSQRRAVAIVKWLRSKGIGKDRLLAKGYGESRLVNECADGQECEEYEHQLNRRTEFRILGKLN